MPSKKINMSNRDKYRVAVILLCLALMIYGVAHPASVSFGACVPVDTNGEVMKNTLGKKWYIENVFLVVGGFGLAVLLGLVQVIKAWRGEKAENGQ
jgi:cytochrome bd-type quinol oxidase subunit 2